MPNIGDLKTVTKNGKRYQGVYTASGWKWSSAMPAPAAPSYTPPATPPKSSLGGIAESASGAVKGISSAAKAVASAATSGKATRTVTLTGKDGTKTRVPQRLKNGEWVQVDGAATRAPGTGPGSSPGSGSSSGQSGSGSGSGNASGSGSGSRPAASSSPAPSRPKSKPKPGKTYVNTRNAYKAEQDNQPRHYETPEQRQERMSKSKFDMDMSGADVKAKRKKYLDTHPAAAKAVANGTMSMGDINLIIRRLSKRGFDWNKLKK